MKKCVVIFALRNVICGVMEGTLSDVTTRLSGRVVCGPRRKDPTGQYVGIPVEILKRASLPALRGQAKNWPKQVEIGLFLRETSFIPSKK